MSQSLRQSELFAGADWRVLYRAFTEINFNASDPPSINRALREYIRLNYAEDFTDWIESSEFVAIIELLSWLAGTLAFKTDINARENFIDTAESRESILRLARFLSYNPRRNQPATGLLKITAIETDDSVFDSFGNNLQNRQIVWNDPEDPEWFERFVIVLNSALISSNPYGLPLKSDLLGGIRTQLYRLNARFGNQSFSFSRTINGTTMPFEICNGAFDDTKGLYERTPDFDSAVQMFYRSDGNGNDSKDTGFFFLFKQGNLLRTDYLLEDPIENRIIDINEQNINQNDVWVQSIDDRGVVLNEWQKVPAVFSANITFNDISAAIRNIYAVTTRNNDEITIRFSDGRFGAVPIGNLRVWYRRSNGLSYQIRPTDMSRVRISIPYRNKSGINRNLNITFSLQENVQNSAARESDDEIRLRAPSVYSTQNRMVSGEDYNTFPLQSNLTSKIKAVNRVYSGHSRFIDLNDPTGSYQDTNVISDDGIFFKEKYDSLVEIPTQDNKTPEEILTVYIQPMLKSRYLKQYLKDLWLTDIREGRAVSQIYEDDEEERITWVQARGTNFVSSGNFSRYHQFMRPGASVQLRYPNGETHWHSIIRIETDALETFAQAVIRFPVFGESGTVILDEPVPTGAILLNIIPTFESSLSPSVIRDISERLSNTRTFQLWYDYGTATWFLVNPEISGNTSSRGISDPDTLRILSIEYVGGILWRLRAPGLRYMFESERKVHWYFDGQIAVDADRGLRYQDLIRLMKINEDVANPNNISIGRDYDLSIENMIYYPDGHADPHRVSVRFRDRDEDGTADDPDVFYKMISNNYRETYLFWNKKMDGGYRPIKDVVVVPDDLVRQDTVRPSGTVLFQLNGENEKTFWIRENNEWKQSVGRYVYAIGRGSNIAKEWIEDNGEVSSVQPRPLVFHWKHFTSLERRIDPAQTNIIDIFVLTREYDSLMRRWLRNGARRDDIPKPPSETQLALTFNEFEQYRMFSDQIVWRPVRFKFLFGETAPSELQAQFKIVKLPSTTVSDGEIKSRVIEAINNYFSASFWDFGETFFFTELAAYLHQQLASIISSVVLVPKFETAVFGNAFEVRSRSDELFLSTASVNDVIIIDSNTPSDLRMLR